MKDVSLQFTDKQQYNDIVINSGWLDTNQQTVFINDIGFVLVFDDPESDTPVLIEKKAITSTCALLVTMLICRR